MKIFNCIIAFIWLLVAVTAWTYSVDVEFIIILCAISLGHFILGMTLLIKEEIQKLKL